MLLVVKGCSVDRPEEYVGGCAVQTDAANMTKEERLEFGARCGAPWPCLHEAGGREFS